MESHQLINQSSGDVEYYTDSKITRAACTVMGGIDLDPASCEFANQNFVGAEKIFTAADDGLSKDWFGRVWMNHPFGKEEHVCSPGCAKKTCEKRGYCCTKYKPGNKQWIDKLVAEVRARRVTQACCICFASTSEAWFKPLMAYPQCYLSPRTNYYGPDGNVVQGVSKGSVVTYFGPDVHRFARIFECLGSISVPYSYLTNVETLRAAA